MATKVNAPIAPPPAPATEPNTAPAEEMKAALAAEEKKSAPPAPAAKVKEDHTELTNSLGSWDDLGEAEMARFEGQLANTSGLQLPQYPPRTGPDGKPMDQRYVGTRIGGELDRENIQKALDAGWRPRPVDTLPGVLPVNYDGFGTPVIGFGGMVLMERPKRIGDAERQRVAEARRVQIAAVKSQSHKQFGEGGRHGEVTGFTSSRGRGVGFMDD